MRILFLANDDEGLYKFRKELIEILLSNNEVFISLPKGKYVENLVGMGCKFIDTNFNRKGTNPISDLKLIKLYCDILNKIKPDIVLTYTIKPNVYGGIACQIKKIPYVVNITGLGSAVENGGILHFITLSLYKIGLRKAQNVFFQNEFNRGFMIKHGCVKGNNKLVPGSGVNLNEFKLMDYPNSKTIDFVYIGRIMTEKGFGQYIRAAQIIKDKYPQTRFHVCGLYEDDYKAQVDELVKKDVLIYHGSVSNMKEIYSMISCTVHPTYYPEGLSNVLLESLACGRPIITTDRPGCREVIEDGINGYIVKQKDADDLIDKIEKFINLSWQERKRLGLNGRRKVEQQFDRQIVIDSYLEEIYKNK